MGSRTQMSIRRTMVVALLMVVTAMVVPSSASAAVQDFPGVPDDHQFYTEVSWLAGEGITTGYADGTFRPNSAVKRDEVAAFLYRMAGRPSVSNMPAKSPFSDLMKSDRFYKEVVWLRNAGITTGYADGTFRSSDTISRAEIAAFLYRFKDSPSVDLPKTAPFSDLTTKTQFYKQLIWLYTDGITTGYADGTFRPKADTAREAMAAFLYRASGHPLDNPPLDVPKSFTVKGAGYGHGVGMSQYGAYGMALEGKTETQILTHYYQGTAVKTVDANKTIRVEVFGSGTDSRNSADLVVKSPGNDTTDDGQWIMRFYNANGAAAPAAWTGKNNEVLHVTRSGNSVKVKRGNGDTAVATKDISLQWEATSYHQPTSAEDPYVEINKTSGSDATHGLYRHGKLLISVPSPTYPRLIIANELKLNTEYLYGIAEMPSSWGKSGPESLQAQAIAARGYALNAAKSYNASCNCNLYDDTRSQNFTGWKKESEGTNEYYGKFWVAAVEATASSNGTKGKILMYGSALAKTYYFSSTGGQTENSDDVWVSQPGYLESVDDTWSLNSRNPNAAWTYTLTQAKARSVFGLGDVKSIKVTSRTSGGSDAAAKIITATSSSGETASISGPEKIRSKLVNGKSPWIWSFGANY